MKNKKLPSHFAKAKAFDKSQHPFKTETFNKLEIEWKCLNLIKGIDKKPESTPYLVAKDWMLFPTIMTKTEMSTLATFIQLGTRGSSQGKLVRKRNKSFHIWKRRSKTISICM